MVATTTLKPSFRQLLQNNYPKFTFIDGDKFTFRPPKTIIIGPPEPNDALLLLHELGHALSDHNDYNTHIERLKIETEAWSVAKKLCQEYNVPYDEDFVEAQLDTYRDWLHTKSICKKCGLTRCQSQSGKYYCPLCDIM